MPFGSLSVDKITTSDGFTLGGSGATMKNRIINGAMVIDQRYTGSANTPTNTAYVLDRWRNQLSQSGKFTIQRSATAPDGFANSMVITSTSSYSVGADDYFSIQQPIEGFNTEDLGWGTSGAKTITLSFWARASNTGTFGGSIINSGYDYGYPFTYTINTADTFEYKTVTISGPTSGTWVEGNGVGLRVMFDLGTGSNRQGTAGQWNSANAQAPSGAFGLVTVNAATLYLTGVQFEVGSQATSFDYRQYGTELALCQRYYEKTVSNGNLIWTGDATSGNNYYLTGQFVVPKRATPTFTGTGTGGNGFNSGAPADAGGNAGGWNMGFTCTSTGVRRYFTAGFTASAEL
jgi:hypothetical protein